MAERTTHSFHSKRGFHLFWGIVVVVLGVGLFIGEVAALADPSSKWAQGGSPWDASWSILLGLLSTWLGIRLLRLGVQISSGKMTIRGYLVTRTVNASDIRAITLQPNENIGSGLRWKPRVELTGGKGFWIESFDCGPAREPPKPKPAATVEEVRVLLGLRAKGISTPHSHQDDPSGQPDRHDDEQPQDPMTDLPRDAEPQLDANGIPVQDRSARGRTELMAVVCLIGGLASVGLAITVMAAYANHNRVNGLVGFLGVVIGLLPWLAGLSERKDPWAAGRIYSAGVWLGLIGSASLVVFYGGLDGVGP